MKSKITIQRFPNYFWLLLLFFMLSLLLWGKALEGQNRLKLSESNRPAHIDTALTYFGVQDLPGKDNHGQAIKKFLDSVNLPQGNPYCAAFASYCLNVAGAKRPKVRTALATNFITDDSIDAKDVMYGRKMVPTGTIAVWRRGNTMFGHAGFVLYDWCGAVGITIEGNTTATKGSDVEGVFIRKRTIYPANYFRIVQFTIVTY